MGKRTRERWWCGWRLILYVYTQLHIIIDTEAFTGVPYARIVVLPNRISLVVLCYSFTKKSQWYSFSRRHFLVSIIFRVPFVRSFVGVLIEIDAGRSVLSFEKVSSSPTKDSLSPHFSSRRRRERETCARAKAITSSSSSPSSS